MGLTKEDKKRLESYKLFMAYWRAIHQSTWVSIHTINDMIKHQRLPWGCIDEIPEDLMNYHFKANSGFTFFTIRSYVDPDLYAVVRVGDMISGIKDKTQEGPLKDMFMKWFITEGDSRLFPEEVEELAHSCMLKTWGHSIDHFILNRRVKLKNNFYLKAELRIDSYADYFELRLWNDDYLSLVPKRWLVKNSALIQEVHGEEWTAGLLCKDIY